MSFANSLPGLEMNLRRHASAAGLAFGVAALSMAAYAAAAADAASSPQFAQNCVACHGADAKGVEGLGVSLVESDFVAKKSEKELVAFLKEGRMPDDPNTRSGRPMPGFSWVPEADLQAIASYLKASVSKK